MVGVAFLAEGVVIVLAGGMFGHETDENEGTIREERMTDSSGKTTALFPSPFEFDRGESPHCNRLTAFRCGGQCLL